MSILLTHQIVVNGVGRLSSSAHRQDDGCRSCDNISSCPDTGFGSLSSLEVTHNVSSLIEFKPRRGCGKKWIRACANGNNRHIAFELEFRTLDRKRPSPS